MKINTLFFWITTGLIALLFFFSAYMYLSQNPELMASFKLIGFPTFFVTLLGVAKLLGAILILFPKWKPVNEWAYAGFGFTLIGAVWTHVATSTPFVMPLVILVLLGVSYWLRNRMLAQTA